MSRLKDDFFELLTPMFEAKGYKFLKSKNRFTKTKGSYIFSISLKWEGRGGIVMIDWMDYEVSSTDKANAFLKWGNIHHSDGSAIPVIPVMYSRRVLEAANEMNLKKLAAIPYDEKYPPESIRKCVHKIWELYEAVIMPAFKTKDD